MTATSRRPSPRWMSAHLYLDGSIYETSCDDILTGIVGPFAGEVFGSGMVDRFFFVRYPEGGAHVRLRLHPAEAGLDGRIREALEALTRGGPGKPTPGSPRPGAGIHDLRWIPYEPEWDRYGGVQGVEVAEEFFHISSEAALDQLRDLPPEEDARLGRALVSMVVFVETFCASRESALAFLRHYYASYLRSVAFAGVDEADWLDAFSDGFAAQSQPLEAHVAEVWSRLESGRTLSATLDHYRHRLRSTVSRLRMVQERGSLHRAGMRIDSWDGVLLAVVPSYLHMANNRMGVPIRKEAYLAYLIAEALSGGRIVAAGGSVHVQR